MSSRYHPEDTEAVERLHARFMADNDLNDQLIEFQDKAYAMGRARGLQEALPAFDEAAERAALELAYHLWGLAKDPLSGAYLDIQERLMWDSWLACAKRKAGVQ